MEYFEVQPSACLAKYVRCFWSLKLPKPVCKETPEPVIPDGCQEIIFNLADPFRRYRSDGSTEVQPLSILVGQMRRHVLLEPTGRTALFGIRFQPDGAFPFLRLPLSELTDRIESLDSFWGGDAKIVEEQIYLASTFEQRVKIAERFLLRNLIDDDAYDSSVGIAVDILSLNRGLVSIENLARRTDISERQLVRKFQRHIGVSPKFFSRVIRMQSILSELKSVKRADTLNLALSNGFYDQSHFIKEFREFSGQSPTMFLENQHQLSEVFIG